MVLLATPASAVMDIADRGPLLRAGAFAMRITNIGVIGNAFFNNGLSFDPSFEFPRGSGHELLNHADLWVGARVGNGPPQVSGGPMMEWRPTLEPGDTVRVANAGDPGTLSYLDDDGDGRVDEERLNGRDDDGDGRVDEDFLLPAQQMVAADYTDDQPQAVNFAYPNGERHEPLRLAVHQRAYAWSLPGHDHVVGLEFEVTNRGTESLRDVRLGLYADLDSRGREALEQHLDDRFDRASFSALLAPHLDTVQFYEILCGERLEGEAVVVRDADPASTRAGVALLPLTHTTDVLGWFVNDAFPGVRAARTSARAPRRDTTFRFSVFSPGAPPGQGGPPPVDSDRYAALAGDYPTASPEPFQDFAVLVSCGPFRILEPGRSLTFAVALVAISSPDSTARALFDARMAHRGARLDLQPDGPIHNLHPGETGINGHEACVEPPPGIVFTYDPHCPEKLVRDPRFMPMRPGNPSMIATEVEYRAGRCAWTDLDCDYCTGDDGVDTVRPWEVDMRLPTSPALRATPGDRRVVLEWDNEPERAILAGRVGGPGFHFDGYKVYRLDDWQRDALLPGPERWQRLAVYRVNTANGGRPLTEITDTSLPPDDVGPGGPHYPVGRYRLTDDRALNGFDYHFVVTTILRERLGPADTRLPLEYESPFYASFDDRVVPHAAARAAAGQVWVVPNPYRERAAWERQPVAGDVFTRHVDFMGLPRARSTIKVYTLAGDLVVTLHHDGSNGNGQAAWNLISRNGQDIESGVYLFTVTSPLGHQVGRFVIIR